MWNLPYDVEIDGIKYVIRNKCDYRMVLDVINALNDEELEMEHRIECAITIFYEDLSTCEDIKTAVEEMYRIINNGEVEKQSNNKPPLMNWNHDFKQIAPAVSKVLGYEVREPDRYVHWWTFIGGFMEIQDSTYLTVTSIRSKKQKGKKLDKWEEEFYREHKAMVDLPLSTKLNAEERELLDADW